MSSSSTLQFLGYLWIAEAVLIEIEQMQAQAVLHFTLAQIVQERLPLAIRGQILGDMLGQKNVAGIAAIQHSLGNVDSGTSNIRFVVDIRNAIDRAAVHSHSQLDVGTFL